MLHAHKEPITIIWGPPGTGKTYNMSKLALQFQKRGKKVLIVSHSNVSVDGVIKKIVERIEESEEGHLLEQGKILRYGYVPQVFMAACVAKQHFICVGDFRQLPPIAQSDNKKELEEDIFSFLGIVDKLGNIYDHPWLIMLDVQRRMHPKIARFASHFIYEDLLKTEKSAAQKVQMITDREPFTKEPLIQVDLTGTYCVASKNSDNSRYNLLSAFIAFQMALDNEKRGEHQVGIITPYALQMRLIKAMIQDYRQQKDTQIICSTIHQFQGSEKEVIIFDAIESYPFKQPGVLLDKNEDHRVTRLVNVAVTRARGKLITISHNRFWENKLDNKAHPLYKLLKYQQKYGYVLAKEELNHYLIHEAYTNIKFFNEHTFIKKLLSDINTAKERIRITLPSEQLGTYANEIKEAIVRAIEKGLDVGVKCSDYEQLPIEWKAFSTQDEKAMPMKCIK